jgi:hypothetical protein
LISQKRLLAWRRFSLGARIIRSTANTFLLLNKNRHLTCFVANGALQYAGFMTTIKITITVGRGTNALSIA